MDKKIIYTDSDYKKNKDEMCPFCKIKSKKYKGRNYIYCPRCGLVLEEYRYVK